MRDSRQRRACRRKRGDQFTQSLKQAAPAEFWESVMDDIDAIKATTGVALVKYATSNAIQARSDQSRC